MFCRLMPANIQLNWIKRFHSAKQKQKFGKEVQDYKDGSGLQFINFDFMTGDQEIKLSTLVEFLVIILSC